MSRPLKQLALPLPAPHGGKRKGAGRPNRSKLQAHVRRPRLDRRHPIHVTLKLAPGLPSLRRKDLFKMLRRAVKKARRSGFAVAHFAILSNHVHLILEPKGASVTKVFQSFGISFAKHLNAALERSGPVLIGRYHTHILRTPTEVRNALNYVLTNDAHHRGATTLTIDPFSSAYRFGDLRALVGRKVTLEFSQWSEDSIENWLDEILKPPETWLLREGWKKGRVVDRHLR